MVNIFFVNSGLNLPDTVQPLMECYIFTDAPHHCHTCMSMHIDESGNGCLARTVNSLSQTALTGRLISRNGHN